MGACFSGPKTKDDPVSIKKERARKKEEEERQQEEEVENALSNLQMAQKELDYLGRVTQRTTLISRIILLKIAFRFANIV